jgi:hypothetical protein
MIDTFDIAGARATVVLSPVCGATPFGDALVGTPAAAAVAAGSVAQTWIRPTAFGPMDQSASEALGSNSAPGVLALAAPAVYTHRRHRAPRASVFDSRYRLHCR